MNKKILLTSISILGLSLVVFSFQNCSGSATEFSSGEALSKAELIDLIQNDESVQVTVAEEEEVFKQMVEQEIKVIAKEEAKSIEELKREVREVKPIEDLKKEVEEIVLDKKELMVEIVEINETESIVNPMSLEAYLCKKNGKSKNLKYMVCHVPKGNPENQKTLCLPEVALKSHLKHFDSDGNQLGYMGPCK